MLARVERRGPDECWPWPGATIKGYGYIQRRSPRRSWLVHRLAYLAAHGDPGDLHVLHSCDNPRCCNPAHLRLGTNADNVRDRADRRRGREHQQRGETNPNAKLTDAQVAEIRAAYAAGERQVALAERFGIKQPQVSRIVRGVSRG